MFQEFSLVPHLTVKENPWARERQVRPTIAPASAQDDDQSEKADECARLPASDSVIGNFLPFQLVIDQPLKNETNTLRRKQ